MEFLVDPALVLYIVLDSFFIARSSDGVDIEAGRPESAAPEYLPYLGVAIEEFSCDETFNGTGNFGGREGGNGLEKEMHMIFVRSNFYEGDFVVLSYDPTDVFQGFLYGFRKDFLSAFDGTDKMVKEKGNIVGLPLMLAHAARLLPE
jgi:hypothetical protein